MTYDFQGYESRIQSKDDFSADLFNLNQIGTSSNWESIETWNYGQSGASYAAINSEGELFVWGVNYGALPINDEKSKEAWENGEEYGFVISEPTQARPNEKWKGISLGFKFGVGYSRDGTYYSWGRNLSSQLGNGKPTTYESFLEPSITLGEIIELDAGEQQVGVINKDGKLRMIGSNDQGQLGTGSTNDNTPKELDWEEIEGTIKEVKVTETETQILTTSNQIWAYGDNLYAQLGRGTRDTKAENYEAKKIDEEGWIEVFAISEHVYAFKSDGSLWAWGKNKNFDLGLGYKSEFVSTPTKVEGVDRNDIIDFSPLRGGFVYINTDGELWGAGTNFYTGSWFPLSSPRKIGNDTDWSHFHDFIGSELNILIEKTDGSIWGAGTNWSRVLTENPCPEAKNQINKISLTHPNSYQKTKIEIGEITGTASGTTATITIKVNGTNLTTGNVTNTTDIINETVRLFNANSTLDNNFTLTATPTNSGSSTLFFESKNLVENTFSYSIQASSVIAVPISIIEVEDHVSGTATFTVNINGTRISAAAANVTDAVANLKTSFETSQNFSDQVNNYSFTTSGTSLLIENIRRESFFTTVEVINSSNSNATIETSSIQDRLDVNCWPRYLNNLVEIFPSGNSWDKIALGIKHAIGLDDNGLLYSWGQNDQLQLGLGSNKWEPKNTPTQITSTGTKTFIDIDASAEVSFAIDSDNNMYAWGDNDLGTLAVGDYSDKPYPTLVKGELNWKRNLGGYRFQVALDENDKPYGWGYRKFGQLGALGKVKGDDIVWDTDLSEAQGTIETLNEGEYLIATQEFVNYLETLYNFENSDDSSSSKSNNIKGTVQKST
jgi:alpha-tubulin suppressor-like RCC1 family protein